MCEGRYIGGIGHGMGPRSQGQSQDQGSWQVSTCLATFRWGDWPILEAVPVDSATKLGWGSKPSPLVKSQRTDYYFGSTCYVSSPVLSNTAAYMIPEADTEVLSSSLGEGNVKGVVYSRPDLPS